MVLRRHSFHCEIERTETSKVEVKQPVIFGGRHWRLGARSEMHLSSCRTIFREMRINANNAWDDTSNPLINPSLSRRQRHHWHCTVRKESSCLSATWPNNATCFLPLVWVVKGVEPNWFRENHPVCWLQITKERWLSHRWPSGASLHASMYYNVLTTALYSSKSLISLKNTFSKKHDELANIHKKQLQLLRFHDKTIPQAWRL